MVLYDRRSAKAHDKPYGRVGRCRIEIQKGPELKEPGAFCLLRLAMCSALVLAGKYVLFRFVPHGMVAGGFDIKTVIVNQRAAIGGAKGDKRRRQNR